MRRYLPVPAARLLGRMALAALFMATASAGPAFDTARDQPVARPEIAGADCPPIVLEAEERLMIVASLLAADAPPAGLEAMDDGTLMAALEWHAVTQLGLRVRPSLIDRTWAIEPPRRDVVTEIATARATGRLAEWLLALTPDDSRFRALAAERRRYRAIVESGGWLPTPSGPTLREGEEGPRVEALRVRLTAEGYDLAPPAVPARFDADLTAALTLFQSRHDLDEDGELGPDTRRALDVPATERLAQIDADLERWRWLPRVLPADRLEVDTGAAEAVRFVAGQPVLSMRAIVGAPQHKTPMFVSYVEAVVLNPPWNVPASIARNEILPRAAREPGYLSRNGFVRTPNGLQQRPGPGNALGFVKFDLPSPFGVYLHDTPGRSSFALRVRALSHGCMRLENPRELAADLLGPQGWTSESIDRSIATGVTRRIGLDRTLPLFVIYRTASVDDDGRVVFRRDPYGWDARLLAALAAAERDRPGQKRAACSPDGTSPKPAVRAG